MNDPFVSAAGLLTTMSPIRMSCRGLGTPPPIPTIRANRIEGNVARIWVVTVAADTVPYPPGYYNIMVGDFAQCIDIVVINVLCGCIMGRWAMHKLKRRCSQWNSSLNRTSL
jgi:hypothetical protein